MVTIYNETYKSYRQNVTYLMQDTDIKTKEQLSFLMAQRGFRRLKDGTRLYPSEKQLNLAWEYVKDKGLSIQKIDVLLYREERYKHHVVRRVAVKEIVYNDKKYRKGQFLPKGYK